MLFTKQRNITKSLDHNKYASIKDILYMVLRLLGQYISKYAQNEHFSIAIVVCHKKENLDDSPSNPLTPYLTLAMCSGTS